MSRSPPTHLTRRSFRYSCRGTPDRHGIATSGSAASWATTPEAQGSTAPGLGIALGQTNAFVLVAARCSAAQAEAIRRLGEQKLDKRMHRKMGQTLIFASLTAASLA